MKQTQNVLMTTFVGLVALTLLVVMLFETEILEPGAWTGESEIEFLLTTLMELMTLSCAFLGLRLFKFSQIHNDLVTRRAPALLKWGLLRLELIEVPMLANTLFYYMFLKPTFGYLAIILALCLPFVWPSAARCEADTTDEEP